jgi:pyrimidine-specific ribonucleoside hydrolase
MISLKIIPFALLFIIGLLFRANICFSDGIHRKSVIIDTDMGLDDARAITWLLKMHDLEIEGIITSDGALDPISALNTLRVTLDYYERQEIPISEGIHLDEPDPPFRSTVSTAFSTFSMPGTAFNIREIQYFYESLQDSVENRSLIYVCLGPLSNLAYAIENNPGFINKIEKVLYAGDAPYANPKAWNTNRDKNAADKVFSSFDNIYELDISGGLEHFFSDNIINQILNSDNEVAGFFNKIHNLEAVKEEYKGHLFLYDDIIPLYLQYPEFFASNHTKYGKSLIKIEKDFLQSVYIDFIENGFILSSRPSVVFSQYPIDKALYRDDVSVYTDKIIETHGLEEWKAAILTNEMHRHLGVYSLIGVKMGILAREILGADLDELTVVSYSGLNPPLSCLSDGLQVATGASLGRGTISNSIDLPEYPKAVFIMDSKKIRIELKQEIMKKIQTEIIRLSNQYGFGSHKYFEEIRRMSIHFWVNLNRKYMFEVYNDTTGKKIL